MNSLLRRVQAFRDLLLPGRSYRTVFLNSKGEPVPPAAIVLADLARFCRATKPTVMFAPSGSVDPLASARMDGRREVFLRIAEHLNLDDRVLLQIQHQEDQDDGR